LYTSSNIIVAIKSRIMGWVGHVACMGEMRNAYRIFVTNTERKKPLGRPGQRCEDNIRIDLREIE
jgi:hypothetical protein